MPLIAAYSTSRVSSLGRRLLPMNSKTSFIWNDIFHSESTWLMSKSRVLPLTFRCSVCRSLSASTITSGTVRSTCSSAATIISRGLMRLGSTYASFT